MIVKRCHCDWRKTMMNYSNNMITWQHTWNLIRNTNDTRSYGHFVLLDISVYRCRIIDPGWLLTGGPPAERRRFANARSFAINGAVYTAEDKYRSRLTKGVYGNNMIAQLTCSDFYLHPNNLVEQSYCYHTPPL